ncbi:hypothetical protein F442_03433 [Phytophthora nicotianae P10297]|uniref:Uncharacterized protein n=4 Tax=Phytophthora nicotianae TaxID=4792 RepID=W2PEJ5_PHYN3|nr:hypothetical protein PPTG_24626 [Phytophthora nicotianae INRA-310]ETK93506.1 hypothetical protein L915_03334 [Phytophthora nicotianae]ETO82326.1 hypothetical protein F444_03518 [Phytophthora nicotianae P1976]ETP51440.1 hypothetical protein F442_03433 [Phytophthora nicotianae P10297]ETL46898.1 hypothetical protein L916_03302 [Phytophthora nicotianae]ETM00025.1 hypothetical protein L917_03225 [Phytophthora nicotianae]
MEYMLKDLAKARVEQTQNSFKSTSFGLRTMFIYCIEKVCIRSHLA